MHEERQDAEWQRLRRANNRKLLWFPGLVALAVIGWMIWYASSLDPTNNR